MKGRKGVNLMKNKFLKVLTIGAVCCAGALSLTGCSVDMSDAQINKLMETVEIVTEDFNNLTNTVDEMQKTIDELNEKLDKQSKENMVALVSQAQCNMVMNRQEYMKNCKFIANNTALGYEQIAYYFETPGGVRAYIGQSQDESGVSYYKVIYAENNTKTYIYDSKTDTKVEKATSFDVTIQSESIFIDNFSYIMLNNEQAKNMYRSYNVDKNSDYVVTFIDESFLSGSEESDSSPRVTQIDITVSSKDTTVKQITIKEAVLNANAESSDPVNTTQTIITEIGGVKESDISAMLSTAIAKSVG